MTGRLRVILFGSGSPISTYALAALTTHADVVGVVVPAGPRVRGLRGAVRAWQRRRSTATLRARARECGASLLGFARDEPAQLVESLRALRPDLLAVATFPALLPPVILQAAASGAIGIHPSPLPRHRGPAPLFWTYHHDDAEAGVSVFRLDAGVDTGDLLRQETFRLARGRLGSDLYHEIARRGAALLDQAVAEISAGSETCVPQDERRATHDPRPRPGNWRIVYETWGCERVWHFLRGVGEGGRILTDERGRPLAHGPARSAIVTPPLRPAGTIERDAGGLVVHCHDGHVEVAPR